MLTVPGCGVLVVAYAASEPADRPAELLGPVVRAWLKETGGVTKHGRGREIVLLPAPGLPPICTHQHV